MVSEKQGVKHNDNPVNAPGARSVFFQPKLSISQPNDVYEQEADHMDDRVMRMAGTSLNSQSFFKPGAKILQRKCQACENEEKQVHRKANDGNEVQGSNELNSYIGSLSSSGQPIPQSSRSFFEPRFGHDFSKVRLHTDAVAAKSARSINALAYTTGNHIIFDQHQFSPQTHSGQRLLAHELTHVIQQTGDSDSIKLRSNNQGFIQRGEGGRDTSKDSSDSGSGEGSWLEAQLLCDYYGNKFWLSDREKDEQLFDRIYGHFSDQPDAQKHLGWYRYGKGANYNEDVFRLFSDNPSVRTRVAQQINTKVSATHKKDVIKDTNAGSAPIRQADYDKDNWVNANGNIDEVDWELTGEYKPHGLNEFKISIQDPYTWHPLEERPTQCLHEAMVRLQQAGAKDYLTVGSGWPIMLQLP
jgi:hypothetical protein